ncbi:MAG: hypothetical protein ABGW79_00130, partial [Pirellulales bacterium]
MSIPPRPNISKLLFCLLLNSVVVSAVVAEESQTHGLVGLRPLPRTEEDWKASHGGSWHGTPTYEAQKGKYPFVAEHIDVVSGWLDGDFKTKRVFFEHYWGLAVELDHLDPKKNPL